MLYQKNDSQQYIQEFKKKFTNFCEKAPMLLSFTTTANNVQVIDETDHEVYDIDWDFSVPVKAFIHGVKNLLIENGCYPMMHKIEESEESVDSAEQVQMAIEGADLNSIPVKRYNRVILRYLIDKVIVFKDIFIVKDLQTDKMYRYKMNKSSIYFLKKLRSKKFSLEQGGEYFFANSVLLNEITLKEDSLDNRD